MDYTPLAEILKPIDNKNLFIVDIKTADLSNCDVYSIAKIPVITSWASSPNAFPQTAYFEQEKVQLEHFYAPEIGEFSLGISECVRKKLGVAVRLYRDIQRENDEFQRENDELKKKLSRYEEVDFSRTSNNVTRVLDIPVVE